MVVKLTNKDDNFYQYMGKFFGSRLVQKETNDRIYDDSDKVWYIYLKNKVSLGFISISENSIKNIYSVKPEYLSKLFEEIRKDITISPSVVTNLYVDIYESCNFSINDTCYKNFVIITDNSEGVHKIS